MSANPYDILPWWYTTSGGASGTTSGGAGGSSSARAAVNSRAVSAAVQAAAQAAREAAALGMAQAAIVSAAKAAALPAWRGVTGDVEGYPAYEPGIFDQAASLLSPVSSALTPAIDNSSRIASQALSAAGAGTIGALFGSAGTAILLGAGALILLVLVKR